MKLTVLLPPIADQRFECKSCTNCCRELVVHLTPLDREKIDRQQWAGKIAGPAYVRLGREYVLNHAPGGGCVFLREDGLCRIHAEFGGTEKPLACQLYPFTLEPEASNLRVGIRFDCPTVARNEGPGLAAHRSAVTSLAGQLAAQMPERFQPARSPMLLTTGRAMSDKELAAMVRCLDRWLSDPRQGLAAKLTGLSSFVDTLTSARLSSLPEGPMIELIEMVVGDLPNAVAESTGIPPPTPRQRRLLRQAVFAHGEHITLQQARAGLLQSVRYRWNQLVRARQLSGGQGTLPPIGSQSKRGHVVTAVALEQVAPAKSDACAEIVTRYLRARISTHSFSGSCYYGWPVLDGLAALLLAVAAIGWLACYFAVEAERQQLEIADMIRAVGVVDRASGRARELGTHSAKLRLAYLRQDAGLLRLTRAYPIMAL